MEYIVIALISLIVGFCMGNTTIRSKIIAEIKSLRTEKTPPPIRARVSYVPPQKEKTPLKSKIGGSVENGGCNKCGSPVQPIDKMPGYYFCEQCNSITSKKKANVG